MAVELQELYDAVCSSYDIRLRTKSCYERSVEWLHMVEGLDFVKLLHGDELALNSGMNYHTDEWLMEMIDSLNEKGVGGLVLTLRDGTDVSQEIIDHCDEIRFPLFTTAWETPYVEIMRIFSVILLRNNEKETSLSTSLKNAIYFHDKEETYRNHLERYGYQGKMEYQIAMLGVRTRERAKRETKLQGIQMKVKRAFRKCITYIAGESLIILFAGEIKEEIAGFLGKICRDDAQLLAGLGGAVPDMREIYRSFEKAEVAYRMTKTAAGSSYLDYEKLGVYKLIAGVEDQNICEGFVEEVLGKLLEYDRINNSSYLPALEAYFDHDCSIIRTSKALYFHENTMKYKLKKIKEILGYDILCNENRMKIMLALCIMRSKTHERGTDNEESEGEE